MACATVAIVLVAGALFGSAFLGKRQAKERAAQALGEAHACLYGGPLAGETRAARLLSIELCERHLNSRLLWPTECLPHFTAFRRALEDGELQNDEQFREVYSLAEPKLDVEGWADSFAEAAAKAGITEVPGEAKKWCRTPPAFSPANAKPLARGVTTQFRFESEGPELRFAFQTQSPKDRTHICLLRERPDGPEGRCHELPEIERPMLVPSEDPGIVAVRDGSRKSLFVRGATSSDIQDVSAVSAFARDGRLLEILEGKVRVTPRGGKRGELVRWPALDRAEGDWNLAGDRVLWTEKGKDGRTLWIQTAGAGGEATGEPLEIGSFRASLSLSLPGYVASCALDPRRRVIAVRDENRVRIFVHDGATIAEWGKVEVGQPSVSLTDHPKLGCEGGAAFLAWKDGDQVQTARCTQTGCGRHQGKADLNILRPLATAGKTVVLVERRFEGAGSPIVVQRGLASEVLSSAPSIVALDESRGGPLAIRHELHVVSTANAVWILSAPERTPGGLFAFRVDADGNIAAVRPAESK